MQIVPPLFMKTILSQIIFLCALFCCANAFSQGGLTPANAPDPTMKTLAQIEPRIPISSLPFTVTKSGSYYLTTNLTVASGSGITVNADDVSLDLGGWTLASSAGSSVGILSFSTNLFVRNGTVRGFGIGLQLNFASETKVERVNAVDNSSVGIFVGDKSAVIDCTAIRNGGRGIDAGAHCQIRSCRSYENGGVGIFTLDSCVIQDSIAGTNSLGGFQVGKGVSLRGCVAHNNSGAGISAGESALVSDCSAKNNVNGGMNTGAGSFVRDSLAANNLSHGFSSGAGSHYAQVNAIGNSSNGINLFYNGGLIERSMVISNMDYGIYISGNTVVTDCLIASNCLSGGAVSGLFFGGSRNRIENNTITRNGNYGIWNGFFAGATNNLIIRNHLSGQTNNITVGAANHSTTATGANVTTNLNPYVNFSLP